MQKSFNFHHLRIGDLVYVLTDVEIAHSSSSSSSLLRQLTLTPYYVLSYDRQHIERLLSSQQSTLSMHPQMKKEEALIVLLPRVAEEDLGDTQLLRPVFHTLANIYQDEASAMEAANNLVRMYTQQQGMDVRLTVPNELASAVETKSSDEEEAGDDAIDVLPEIPEDFEDEEEIEI